MSITEIEELSISLIAGNSLVPDGTKLLFEQNAD